jgi:hypothetical protein
MRRVMGAVLAILPLPAVAQSAPQKPEREMSTDRPDKTESPYSVPAGRIQVELDFATYTRDRERNVSIETISAAPFNLKLGIGDSTDVQLIVQPYVHQAATDRRTGAHATTKGFGDVVIRVKRNLWGNDEGTTAFALMPFVSLPTAKRGLGSGTVDFGLIAPLAIGLSDTIGLGLMTEVDVSGDDDGDGRTVSFINSATLSFALSERSGMYTEVFTERGDEWIVTGDLGFTYALSDETQLDAGVNVGLNDAADAVAVFVGLSRRF